MLPFALATILPAAFLSHKLDTMSDYDKDPNHVNGLVSTDQIRRALEVIHDARSPNSLRQKASDYLEQIKSDEEAPYHGYQLAADRSQASVVRHYGLSVLENAVRHHWADYSLEQSTMVRDWELSLAQTVTDQDPFYIRTKIASIWVEIAKRSWALNWMDMDERLVRLWDGSLASKELVLTILETLSEDVFGHHEDSTAGLRGTDIGRACVDIFTPMSVLLEQFPSQETSINVRYGEEGWLSRMADLLELCISKEGSNAPERACAVKILGTLRSVMAWAIPRSISTSNLVTRLCQCLASPYLPIQLVSILRYGGSRECVLTSIRGGCRCTLFSLQPFLSVRGSRFQGTRRSHVYARHGRPASTVVRMVLCRRQ